MDETYARTGRPTGYYYRTGLSGAPPALVTVAASGTTAPSHIPIIIRCTLVI